LSNHSQACPDCLAQGIRIIVPPHQVKSHRDKKHPITAAPLNLTLVDPRPLTPVRSAAAIRAERFRERQKLNPDFKKQEADRKREQRADKKRDGDLQQLIDRGLFPLNLNLLRQQIGAGLIMTEAPQGKGKLVIGDAGIQASENRQAENSNYVAPLREQPTADEIRAKLPTTIEGKIELLKKLEVSDGDDLSIDEFTTLFDHMFSIDRIKQAMDADQQDGPVSQFSSDPNYLGSDRIAKRKKRLPNLAQQENKKARPELEVIDVIFNRPKAEAAMASFIKNRTSFTPMQICMLCQKQIRSGYDKYGSIEVGYHHLRIEHPEVFKQMLEVIRKAAGKCTDEDHQKMLERMFEQHKIKKDDKVQCGICRRTIQGKYRRAGAGVRTPKKTNKVGFYDE